MSPNEGWVHLERNGINRFLVEEEPAILAIFYKLKTFCSAISRHREEKEEYM